MLAGQRPTKTLKKEHQKVVHFAPESIVHYTPELIVHFTPEYSIIKYRLDFGIDKYTNEVPAKISKKYGIECDGYEYHSTKDQLIKDNKRSRNLLLLNGITTTRYLGTEIFNFTENDIGEFLWNL